MLAVEYNLGRVVGATGASGTNGRSTWIKYNTAPQDSGATITWSSGQNYIGIQSVVAATHPATGYTWSLFIPASVPVARPATLVVGFDNTCDFNITNYGGTDYTNSAQTVINAAINALTYGVGGKIILREGVYNLTASIYMQSDRITLEGMGKSTVLNRAANFTYGLVRMSNYSIVKGLHFDGKRSSYPNTDNYGIYASYYGIITENHFTGNYVGVYGLADNVIVSANTLMTNMRGIVLESPSSNSNNAITGNVCTGGDTGIYASNSATITGNTCNGVVSGIYGSGNNNTITGNTCSGGGTGIYIYGSYNTVCGNTINNNSAYALRLMGGGNYNLLVGNQLHNNLSGIQNSGTGNLIINNKNGALDNLTNGVWT